MSLPSDLLTFFLHQECCQRFSWVLHWPLHLLLHFLLFFYVKQAKPLQLQRTRPQSKLRCSCCSYILVNLQTHGVKIEFLFARRHLFRFRRLWLLFLRTLSTPATSMCSSLTISCWPSRFLVPTVAARTRCQDAAPPSPDEVLRTGTVVGRTQVSVTPTLSGCEDPPRLKFFTRGLLGNGWSHQMLLLIL